MTSRTVGEIIEQDRGLVYARPEDTVRTAVKRMAKHVCGSILVMHDERLLGIFTERDLLMRVAATGLDLERTKLRDVMTKDPDTIGAEEPVEEAIRRMDEFSYRYLPVIADGRIIGVISLRHLPFGEVIAMQQELEQRHALAENMR
jgi:CBS domain-containing protein